MVTDLTGFGNLSGLYTGIPLWRAGLHLREGMCELMTNLPGTRRMKMRGSFRFLYYFLTERAGQVTTPLTHKKSGPDNSGPLFLNVKYNATNGTISSIT